MTSRVPAAVAALALAACSSPALMPELAEAERLERAGRTDAALAAYERAQVTCRDLESRRRRRDRCAEAHIHRAALLARTGRARAAADAFAAIPEAVHSREAGARGLYRAGTIHLELGDGERAYALLWRTVTHYADTPFAADAAQRIVADGRRRSPRQLYAVLRELWGALADTAVADNLVLHMAELAEHELADPSAALALYDLLAADYPESGLHDDALWRGAHLARGLERPRGAVRRYRALLDTREDTIGPGSLLSVHLDNALLELGRVLRDDVRDHDGAAAAFRRLPEEYPDSILRDDALWELAATWARAGNGERACAALGRLRAEWPGSKHELERAPALRARLGCDG